MKLIITIGERGSLRDSTKICILILSYFPPVVLMMKVVNQFLIEINKETKKKIVDLFAEKGANSPCPMCRNKSWELADGYFKYVFQYEQEGIVSKGDSMAIIGMICKNCGFISEHALGKLGKIENFEN